MSDLLDQLKRRGVLRVGAAYVAVVWLVLQVIDVLGDILVLPDRIPRHILLALIAGFPAALALAWFYEITPEGLKAEADHPAHEVVGFGGRKVDFVIIGALSLVIVLLVIENYVMRPAASNTPQSIPRVSEYRQLTQSPILFPPTPSELPVVSDGARLYFSEWQSGRLGLRQMSRNGGEAVAVDPYIGGGNVYTPNTITPDGRNLAITSFAPNEPGVSIWHVPIAGGTSRRVAAGALPRYSSDGSLVTYVSSEDGGQLMLARADFTEPRLLASVPGRIHWPSFSPDGSEIRFHYLPPRHPAIWRVATDGTGLRRLFPEWENVHHCCGVWTPDGKYFVFEARRNDRSQLYAIREGGESPAQPVQITSGALDFIRPTIDDNGRTIYAVGWQLRGEVVARDPVSGIYIPLPGLESLSAEGLAYSRDGKWVAYISYPQGQLWRSTRDGRQRLQLTQPPMEIQDVRWSPDGRRIAFRGQMPAQKPRCYVVSVDGGAPRPLTDGDPDWQWSAAWAPDSRSIAFSEEGKTEIQLIDLATREVSAIEGTEGLRSPDWSPDGRYLAVNQGMTLKLFELATGQVEDLLVDEPFDFFTWSADSQWLYYVEDFGKGLERAIRRINIRDKTRESVATIGSLRATWGTYGFWYGITPEGEPMYLRNLSIHHLYALDWLPE